MPKCFFNILTQVPTTEEAVLTWYIRYCLKVLLWSAMEHKLSMLTLCTWMKNHLWTNTDFVYWKTEKLGCIAIMKLALCNFCQTFHYTLDNVLRYCILTRISSVAAGKSNKKRQDVDKVWSTFSRHSLLKLFGVPCLTNYTHVAAAWPRKPQREMTQDLSPMPWQHRHGTCTSSSQHKHEQSFATSKLIY